MVKINMKDTARQILIYFNALRDEYKQLAQEEKFLSQEEKSVLEQLKEMLKMDDVFKPDIEGAERKKISFNPILDGSVDEDDRLELDTKYQAVLNAKLLKLALIWLSGIQQLPNFIMGFARAKIGISMASLDWKHLCSNDQNIPKFLILKMVADLCRMFAANQQTAVSQTMLIRALALYKAAEALYARGIKANLAQDNPQIQAKSPLAKVIARAHSEAKEAIGKLEADHLELKEHTGASKEAGKEVESIKDLADQEHTDPILTNFHTRPSL